MHKLRLYQYSLQRRAYSDHTIKHYINDLEIFKRFIDKKWEHITKHEVRDFIDQQLNKKCAHRTINRRLHAIKAFYLFLQDEWDEAIVSPIKKSHFIRIGRPLPDSLEDQQVKQFFTYVTDTRDRAIFALMLHCGLRVAEVANLRLEDINVFAQEIRFFGKGRKERVVPLSNETLELMKQCLKIRPHWAPLFFWNKKQAKESLKINSIQRLLKRYAQKAGMDLHCHLFRHTFARQMTEKGLDRTTLKSLMGHASISSTDAYGKLSDPFIRKSYFQAMEKIESEISLKKFPN